LIVVMLWMSRGVPGGDSPAMSIVMVRVPGVSGCNSTTHPSATDRYGRVGGPDPGAAPKCCQRGD
jgi:hypothetical protein